jgi:hypothetical protein
MTAGLNQAQSVAPPRRGRTTFAIALALAVMLLGIGLVAWLVIAPAKSVGDASAVSAGFLGYTNNGAGKRVAVFRIHNRSALAIRRQWYYEVQVLTSGTWVPQPTVRLPYARGPVISPNQSEIWTINAPAANGKWRVWFPYVEHQTRLQEIKETIRRKLRNLGLRLKGSGVTYTGLTDEVSPAGAQ